MVHWLRWRPRLHWMDPTSTSNMYKVFENISKRQMDLPSWHFHQTSLPKFMERAKFFYHSWDINDVMVVCLRPQTRMEWFPHPLQAYIMCLRTIICCEWVDGSTIILSTLAGLWPWNTGVGQIPGSQLGYKWCHGALVKAPHPHGIVPTSTSNIYKMFEIIHVLWMGRWIHHDVTSTIILGPDFRELAEYVCHTSWTTNDVMVYCLMTQTHMKWFPHPLQTYTRCLRSIMGCGWADGGPTIICRLPF